MPYAERDPTTRSRCRKPSGMGPEIRYHVVVRTNSLPAMFQRQGRIEILPSLRRSATHLMGRTGSATTPLPVVRVNGERCLL